MKRKPRGPKRFWAEAEAELAISMRRKGASNEEVFEAMHQAGFKRTRDSVSKFLRAYVGYAGGPYGQPRKFKAVTPKTVPAPEEPERKQGERPQPWSPPVQTRHFDMPPEVREVPIEAPIFFLRARHCRFPLWPDFTRPTLAEMRFCGEPVTVGSSWCPACRARVATKVREPVE